MELVGVHNMQEHLISQSFNSDFLIWIWITKLPQFSLTNVPSMIIYFPNLTTDWVLTPFLQLFLWVSPMPSATLFFSANAPKQTQFICPLLFSDQWLPTSTTIIPTVDQNHNKAGQSTLKPAPGQNYSDSTY